MKYTVAILKNEQTSDHKLWLDACKTHERIESADVIDLLSNDWLRKVCQKSYDAFLLKPSGIFSHTKQLYDERVLLISENFDSLIYPSLQELLIYENKRFLRDWLMLKNLPHPLTCVFYDKKAALDYLKTVKSFPLVAKTNIGASGRGVEILSTHNDTYRYIQNAFGKGIFTRTGPKFHKGTLLKKIRNVLQNRNHLSLRVKQYRETLSSPQRGFVILQEYIPHTFEWRCVRIGDSYFAHKKIVKKQKSSGSLIKDYGNVPEKLLDFVRQITDENNIKSVAIDIFEHENKFLINEIQCMFGQSDPYQMLIDGKPGRYRYINGKWVFEEGMYNTNCSYDLRMAHLISLLDSKRNHEEE